MSAPIVRIDSGEEQFAWLQMMYGPQGAWQVLEQSITTRDGEAIEINVIRLPNGESVEVRFGPALANDDDFGGEREDEPSTTWLDRVIERAVTYSAENPPHHPGTIARFPVPAAGYANAISVPMAIIAEDSGRAGLYAPPRLVALDRVSLEPIGVGEYPGFDPEYWPPERLADWPLPTVRTLPQEQLAGTIQRLSATWSRVIDAWFANDDDASPHLAEDIGAAREAMVILDAPAMASYTVKANPVFAKWVASQGQ